MAEPVYDGNGGRGQPVKINSSQLEKGEGYFDYCGLGNFEKSFSIYRYYYLWAASSLWSLGSCR